MASAVHLLFPVVISLTMVAEFAYKKGLSQPIVDCPAAFLAALTRDTMPATTGQDAEVPETT